MHVCRHCGGALARLHRKFYQRFLFQAVFSCKSCTRVETKDRWFLFPFGHESSCPECGSLRIEKMRAVDRIDRMYRNPFSYIQRFFGSALHWCPLCRLQFYDHRRKISAEGASVANPAGE